VVFTLRADDNPDADGWAGGCCFTGGVPVGGGMHGGLHAIELNNLLTLAGEGIRQNVVTDRPAGLIDVAPTALHLLGLDAPPTMTGRVVAEAFEREPLAPPPAEVETFEAGAGDYRQRLTLRRVGGTTYIERGWTA
jgi:phosphonoacetate hydrolase